MGNNDEKKPTWNYWQTAATSDLAKVLVRDVRGSSSRWQNEQPLTKKDGEFSETAKQVMHTVPKERRRECNSLWHQWHARGNEWGHECCASFLCVSLYLFCCFCFFLSMERRKKGEEERRRKERIDSLEKWRKWWDILTFSRETQMQTFPVSWQGRERVCRVTSHGFGFKPFGFCDRHIWENLSSSSLSAPSCLVSKIEFSPATATFQLSMHTRGRKSPSSSSWSPVPVSSSVMPSSSDTRPYPDWGETTHR